MVALLEAGRWIAFAMTSAWSRSPPPPPPASFCWSSTPGGREPFLRLGSSEKPLERRDHDGCDHAAAPHREGSAPARRVRASARTRASARRNGRRRGDGSSGSGSSSRAATPPPPTGCWTASSTCGTSISRRASSTMSPRIGSRGCAGMGNATSPTGCASSRKTAAILAVCAVEWEMFLADAVVETHDRITSNRPKRSLCCLHSHSQAGTTTGPDRRARRAPRLRAGPRRMPRARRDRCILPPQEGSGLSDTSAPPPGGATAPGLLEVDPELARGRRNRSEVAGDQAHEGSVCRRTRTAGPTPTS